MVWSLDFIVSILIVIWIDYKLGGACPCTGEEDCETRLFKRSVECGCEFHVLTRQDPLSVVFWTKTPCLTLNKSAIYIPAVMRENMPASCMKPIFLASLFYFLLLLYCELGDLIWGRVDIYYYYIFTFVNIYQHIYLLLWMPLFLSIHANNAVWPITTVLWLCLYVRLTAGNMKL